MITKDGCLFHIDFGHFLGNFKSKLGIKRERAPFVFTPAFAHVLGGRKSSTFAAFVELCAQLYVTLRRHEVLIRCLLSLMLSCGIPELHTEHDLKWLDVHFMNHLTDEEAKEHFKETVIQCLNTRTTQLNDAAHLLRHA
jgi:phosphatidylinositol-4,5-bisphosphate 3-kinase